MVDDLSRRASIPPAEANRARGALRATFARTGARTQAARVFETGGYRLRMPRTHHEGCDAVMVNTGGGMAGGDALNLAFAARPGACVTLTTTAAEKIYRAEGADTRVAVTLSLDSGARLDWLPQEAILFDGARFVRTLDVDMAGDAHLLLGEMLVFGRLAMGETMRRGLVRDRWRVRRDGRLAAAEDVRLDGDVAAALDRAACGGGARALATLLFVSPEAEGRLAAVRDGLDRDTGVTAGASAWNGLLVVRALAASPERLRSFIVALLPALRERPMPRSWL